MIFLGFFYLIATKADFSFSTIIEFIFLTSAKFFFKPTNTSPFYLIIFLTC